MIRILVGIPSSGKTTCRNKIIQIFREDFSSAEEPVVISRDDLRAELAPYRKGKFIGNLHFEERVTELFNKRFCKALEFSHDIILDNMNIRPRYIRETLSYIKHYGRLEEVVITFGKYTNNLEKCLQLNEKRPKEEQVPEDAIRKCYQTYKANKKEIVKISEALTSRSPEFYESIPEPKYIPRYCKFAIEPYNFKEDENTEASERKPIAFIFDIDGTLAAHNRSPYDYVKCETDSVIEANYNVLKALWDCGYGIISMSGRPEKDNNGVNIRKLTQLWLEENNIPYDKLFMRKEGDSRSDDIVKYELFNENVRYDYKVEGVFDDRLRVIGMWEELNIPVFNVNNGMGEY